MPLPKDGLKAVNVYVISTDDGLVLVDGGWAIPEVARAADRCLRSIGSGFGDIRRFLVTHIHRDHYTLARVLGRELGVDVALGRGEEPRWALNELESSPRTRSPGCSGPPARPTSPALEPGPRRQGGAPRPAWWEYPDSWLDGDLPIPVGARTLDAVHTPGHTPGHYVFADQAAGLLFAGDHVLPTITPSIGFTVPPTPQPLGDFMASLTKVRALPDLRILPAHGPVAASSHARVDELLVFHENRLERCVAALAAGPLNSARGRRPPRLDPARARRTTSSTSSARGMAAMETKAHLELLVARGEATRSRNCRWGRQPSPLPAQPDRPGPADRGHP